MGRSAKTTIFLKECMSDALLRLMGEKSMDKITFQEIAKTAGVGRSTWFRNFSDKSEALTFKLTQLWRRWAEEHSTCAVKRYTVDNAKDFFNFVYSIRDTINAIYKANGQSCIYSAFYEIIQPQQTSEDEPGCYQGRFYSYGLFGLLDAWVKRGFFETPEEMTTLYRKMLPAMA